MPNATDNQATYPAYLLRNPTQATEFQRELMVGISQAEARGDHTTKKALAHLLKATVEVTRLAGDFSDCSVSTSKPSARPRNNESEREIWYFLTRMWGRTAGHHFKQDEDAGPEVVQS